MFLKRRGGKALDQPGTLCHAAAVHHGQAGVATAWRPAPHPSPSWALAARCGSGPAAASQGAPSSSTSYPVPLVVVCVLGWGGSHGPRSATVKGTSDSMQLTPSVSQTEKPRPKRWCSPHPPRSPGQEEAHLRSDFRSPESSSCDLSVPVLAPWETSRLPRPLSHVTLRMTSPFRDSVSPPQRLCRLRPRSCNSLNARKIPSGLLVSKGESAHRLGDRSELCSPSDPQTQGVTCMSLLGLLGHTATDLVAEANRHSLPDNSGGQASEVQASVGGSLLPDATGDLFRAASGLRAAADILGGVFWGL